MWHTSRESRPYCSYWPQIRSKNTSCCWSVSCPLLDRSKKCSPGAQVVIVHQVIINFLWNSNMKFSYLDAHSFGEMCWVHSGAVLGCSGFTYLSTRRLFFENDLPTAGKGQIFHSNMLNIMSCIDCSQTKLKPLGLCYYVDSGWLFSFYSTCGVWWWWLFIVWLHA